MCCDTTNLPKGGVLSIVCCRYYVVIVEINECHSSEHLKVFII